MRKGVISVHKKDIESTNYIYEYPFEQSPELLNLLNISDFTKFGSLFKTNFPVGVISESKELPPIINNANDWNINLSSNHTQIEQIRLSKLVEIIKKFIGQNGKINIIDFSCSSISSRAPQGATNTPPVHCDIENPIDSSWGGNKAIMISTRKKRKNKIQKKKRKNKSKKIKKLGKEYFDYATQRSK